MSVFPLEIWRKIMNYFIPHPEVILLLGGVNHSFFKLSQENNIWQQCCEFYSYKASTDNENFKSIFQKQFNLSMGGYFPIVSRIVPESFLGLNFFNSTERSRLKICLMGIATKEWFASKAQNNSNSPSLLGAILAYGDSYRGHGYPSRLCLGNVTCSLDTDSGNQYLELFEYIYAANHRWGSHKRKTLIQVIQTNDIFIFYYSPFSRTSFMWMKYRIGEVAQRRAIDLFHVEDQQTGSRCEGFTYKSSTMHRCQRYEVLPIVIVELTECDPAFLAEKSTKRAVLVEEARQLSKIIDCPFIQLNAYNLEEVRAMGKAAIEEHYRMARITNLKPITCERYAEGKPELFMNHAELLHCKLVEDMPNYTSCTLS